MLFSPSDEVECDRACSRLSSGRVSDSSPSPSPSPSQPPPPCRSTSPAAVWPPKPASLCVSSPSAALPSPVIVVQPWLGASSRRSWWSSEARNAGVGGKRIGGNRLIAGFKRALPHRGPPARNCLRTQASPASCCSEDLLLLPFRESLSKNCTAGPTQVPPARAVGCPRQDGKESSSRREAGSRAAIRQSSCQERRPPFFIQGFCSHPQHDEAPSASAARTAGRRCQPEKSVHSAGCDWARCALRWRRGARSWS